MTTVLIVGSGPGAVNAAVPLVAAGVQVTMLDVGREDERYQAMIPAESFSTIRRTDANQHRYFLGDDFEGIPFGKVGLGAQLTPPRQYVTDTDVARLPTVSPEFQISESFALGGLGGAWGAGMFAFSQKDIQGWPITRADLEPHYAAVADRVGVSGGDDDLVPMLGGFSTMPRAEIDSNGESVLARYQTKREELNRQGFFLGRTPLALSTAPHRDRGPLQYLDMEFWADSDRSVYRPRYTVEELRPNPNFTFEKNRFVLSFEESAEGVTVLTESTSSGERIRYTGDALIIAAGALGTARIVLRSLGFYGREVPLLCNPYTYMPSINVAMLGRAAKDRRHSLAQITGMYEPTDSELGSVITQLYSYRSLLTFKLLKEAPLAYREALRIMRLLMSSFAVLGMQHPDYPTAAKTCRLEEASIGADRLFAHYALNVAEEQRHDRAERQVARFFRRLGCWPIKAVRPGHGSSIHYAGTFPMQAEGDEITCDPDCRLRATRAVYLADASTFPYLPSKGLTFTIMANANRIGSLLATRLRAEAAA